MEPKNLERLAQANQERAREVIRECGVIEAWNAIGAEVHLVGSLSTGLLMSHRDIDFHIYTDRLDVAESFRAAALLAEHESVRRMTCVNLIATPETCMEWHAWVTDADQNEWQIDMIHLLRGSAYDGYFERVAERIREILTPETKRTILTLK